MKLKVTIILIAFLILSGCTDSLNANNQTKETSNTATKSHMEPETETNDLNKLWTYYDQDDTSILKSQFDILDADEKSVFDLNQTLIIANKKTKIVYILMQHQSKYNNGVAFSVLYDETGKPMTKEKYIELYKN